jgi:hypothetical protein
MWTLPKTLLKVLTGAIALVAASPFGWSSGAMAANQLSIGVIQYNAKASQGGWTSDPAYGDPLKKQIALIVDKIRDTSNPSPVQFIALEQAGTHSKNCTANNDFLVSCALEHSGLAGWKTILSECDFDQTQLAYSSDWELVATAHNPLVDGYKSLGSKDPDKCWAQAWSKGRPYNIAYFQHVKTKETVLFVIVHMPHQYPDCAGPTCPYGGKYYWDVPQFKRDIQTVVGANVDLKKVHLIVAGDMNDLGNDNDPAKFASIFGDFGNIAISQQKKNPPDPTCCQDNGYQTFFDRIVTNSGDQPQAEVIYLKGYDYPLDKTTDFPNGRHNEEHKAIYGEVTFPATQ